MHLEWQTHEYKIVRVVGKSSIFQIVASDIFYSVFVTHVI